MSTIYYFAKFSKHWPTESLDKGDRPSNQRTKVVMQTQGDFLS